MVDVIGSLGRGLALGEQIAQRPTRDALASLGLERAQVGLDASRQQMARQRQADEALAQQADQEGALRRIRIINQAAKALKQIDPQQLPGAYAATLRRMPQFGIDVSQFPSETPTPQQLDEVIASTEGFIANPERAITEFQRRSLELRERALDQSQQTSPAQERRLAAQERRLQTATDPLLQRELARQKEAGKQEGKQEVETAATLPNTIAQAEESIRLLDKALEHPGLEAATGVSSRLDPRNFTPGTEAYNFNVLMDQLQGRTFLEAFEALKGGGQITQVEGEKAQNAIARLNTAQSTEAFVEAINELKDVVKAGLERSKGSQPKASGTFTSSGGIQFTVE